MDIGSSGVSHLQAVCQGNNRHQPWMLVDVFHYVEATQLCPIKNGCDVGGGDSPDPFRLSRLEHMALPLGSNDTFLVVFVTRG